MEFDATLMASMGLPVGFKSTRPQKSGKRPRKSVTKQRKRNSDDTSGQMSSKARFVQDFGESMIKYWHQRYDLWELYDAGVQMDRGKQVAS